MDVRGMPFVRVTGVTGDGDLSRSAYVWQRCDRGRWPVTFSVTAACYGHVSHFVSTLRITNVSQVCCWRMLHSRAVSHIAAAVLFYCHTIDM